MESNVRKTENPGLISNCERRASENEDILVRPIAKKDME